MYDAQSTSESEVLPGSFEIFKAEGDILFKQGEFKKASDSYNRVSSETQWVGYGLWLGLGYMQYRSRRPTGR